MAPKYAMRKKVDTVRRQDESPDPSGSVEEYLVALLREVVDGVRVTRGHKYKIVKTILMVMMVQLQPEKSQWGSRPAFTRLGSQTEAIQAIQVIRSNQARSRMKEGQAKCDIDFASILQYEIHDRAFGEVTNLPFPYLIQRLYDKAGVPEIRREYERILVTSMVQTKSMKDPAYPALPRRSTKPIPVPQAQTEGPSVSRKTSDIYRDNVGDKVNIEIREQREALDLSTRREGTLVTSSSASTLTSESIGISSEPTLPSTIVFATGVERQRHIEIKVGASSSSAPPPPLPPPVNIPPFGDAHDMDA
ncbi:hypothetical protein FXO38_16966 [Capsicum annuum]|nr:hypothetical protein FXO38_16966 [Capsicum annuum]